MLAAAHKLSPQLRKELNCVAVNRKGCYVPEDNVIADVFSSEHLARRLQQVGGAFQGRQGGKVVKCCVEWECVRVSTGRDATRRKTTSLQTCSAADT